MLNSTDTTDQIMADTQNKATEAVLFVDDEPRILSSLRRLLRPLKLNVFFAESAKEGLAILETHHIDLVVSDMRMPEMDGAEFLTEVRRRWPETVRMLLTGFSDITSTIDALNKGGIYRYISKPWDDEELKEIIFEGLRIRRLERERDELLKLTQEQNKELQDLNANLERKVEARTQEIKQTSDMLDLAYKELRESYDTFVRVFSNFLENREALKKGQSQLVADFSKRIAQTLKLDEETTKAVYYAALLHQIGKVGMPDTLLQKSEQALDETERIKYQQYPLIGEAALTVISGLEETAKLIHSHAERYDGTGFPEKLSGKQIPLGARIISAVRDYIGLQTGLITNDIQTAESAITFMRAQAGKKYDINVIKCLDHFRNAYDVSSLYSDEVQLESHALEPGMRLSRDLLSSKGLLLISKGHVLNESMIEKLIRLEEVEKTKLLLFVAKKEEPAKEFEKRDKI